MTVTKLWFLVFRFLMGWFCHYTVTIITDCADDNAKVRQKSKLGAWFGRGISTINSVGVRKDKDGLAREDLQASLCLVDCLDACEGAPGVILVNVAPRNGDVHQRHENGTPFGYLWIGRTLVVASLDGYTLSLLKKLGLTPSLKIMSIREVSRWGLRKGFWSSKIASRMVTTQFRSLEFVCRVAALLYYGINVPASDYSWNDINDVGDELCLVDIFGNCKTSCTVNGYCDGEIVATVWGELPFYEHLRDVPDGVLALVSGSSGYSGQDDDADQRLLELMLQGGRAIDTLANR